MYNMVMNILNIVLASIGSFIVGGVIGIVIMCIFTLQEDEKNHKDDDKEDE